MPMLLEGSCHCGAVRFTVESNTPVPYQLCLCSICRKTTGVGGSINIGAIHKSLQVLQGREYISKYKAVLNRDTPEESFVNSERNFCSKCSSNLWLWDAQWGDWVYPFASAVDTELPEPAELTCIKLDSKPAYVRLPEGPKQLHEGYGTESLESWHKKFGSWAE